MHHDQQGGRLHLRIVYAGAPLAGKTETLKALLPNLSGETRGNHVFSPQEARGRTVYFDWAEWQGGLFRSGALNCQITTVPGQDALHARRRLLVRAADALVFVIDARRDQMTANRRSLEEVRPWLEREGAPPIPVIYQCNKRDLPDSLDAAAVRTALGLGDAELHESAATRGDGVRICFVAAVGACVRRAEVLIGLNQLPAGLPPVETGAQLLELMRSAEKPVPAPAPSTAAGAEAEALATAGAAPAEPPSARARVADGPRVPWLEGAAGTILSAWPPDLWAVVLQGAASDRATPLAHAPAALQADLGHARFARTWGAQAALADAEPEYRRLVDWTAAYGDALTSPRCVVLTGAEGHGFYAWQVVQRASTLDRLVGRAFEPALPAKDVAHLLAFAANAYLTAAHDLALRAPLLPIHLRTLARQERRTVYADFLPRQPAPGTTEPAIARLEAELRAQLTPGRMAGLAVPDVLREVGALAAGRPSLAETVELLESLLTGR
ncbi:MAG: ADP-ribosylation factor-like protein [Vicinamibacteria bacterium]